MKKNDTKDQLARKIAYLEFVEDQLSTELAYIDKLLKSVGFPRGLSSVKEVARDILQDHSQE
ncbi:hypothetical protein DB42_CV00260 [Neochlamydia sp. EPS4]|uniref:hypothetical protein n=1 Tax=Neochlamydia sp. EPS4 TaxID=1478175 RepID=UPI00058328F6|nr:hypothetical protein [Neochlamydia sp. EPS4]KIC72669.1 hypothetical protein DB42_CV00260 [Neochlamydia sp. EPS4]